MKHLSKSSLTSRFLTCVFALIGLLNISKAQVSLTATAGTLNGTYTNLSSAFTAINAGTHQGDIIIDLTSSFTDVASSVLNSNGAGAALYTSVLIQPSVDGVVMSFATVSGRGVIELNGADNVTINGDNPNTAGINRNLTIVNTATNTTTYTSVIRISLSTLITSGDNNVVRNCILNGSATGRNIAGATSTTGSENTTYAILVGGGASTVTNTTAPNAITSVATTISGAITANAFTATNNQIDACARGIAIQGSATTVVSNLVITNNLIGNPTAGNTTTVYSKAITAQGFSSATISGNTIRNIEAFLNTSIFGIGMGDVSSSGTNATVENNTITHMFNRSTGTFGCHGIALASGNNHNIYNNMIADLTHDMSGGVAFGSANGVNGIRISAGTGHRVYYNSVNLFGAMPGTTTGSHSSQCFLISSTALTGIDVRNNIFSNTITGGTLSSACHVSIMLPAAGTSAMNLTLNNNVYYSGTVVNSNGIANNSATAFATLYTAANFNPTLTTPANNLRAYTSVLNVSGTNDNASFASTTAAPYVSSTNLHINLGASNVSDVNAKAAVVVVTTDIDSDTRDALTPDAGADEFLLAPCSSANGGTITPGTTSTCAGLAYAMSSVGATVAPGITYQWEISATGGGVGFANVSGGTGANTVSYTTDALTTGTYYYRLAVTCANGPITSYSNELTLTVNPLPTVTVTPPSGDFCNPGGTPVSLTASGASTYTWSPASGLSATTGATVTASPTTTTTYTVTGTDAFGCMNTANVTITSVPAPTTPVITPTSPSICVGGNINLTATSSYMAPTSNTLGSGALTTVLSSGTATNFPNPLAHYYGGNKHQMLIRAAELTALGMVNGSSISSIGLPVAAVNTTETLQSYVVRVGHTALTTITTFQTGLTTVRPAAPYNVNAVPGINTIAFSTPFVWNGTDNLIIETSYSNNDLPPTGNVTMTYGTTAYQSCIVYRADNIPAATMNAYTGAVTFSLSARPNITFGFTAPVAITGGGITWSPGTGLSATTGNTVNANPAATTTYTVQAANGVCTSSSNVTVTVGDPLVCTSITAVPSITVCAGTSVTLTANNTGGGMPYSYSWSDGVGGIYPDAATIVANLPAATYTFSVTVTDACGGNCTMNQTITIDPAGGTASGPGTGITGQNLTYTVTGFPVGSTFQWQSSPTSGGPYTNIPGATSSTYNTTPATPGTTHYVCVITSGTCVVTSNQVTTVVTLAGDNVCGALPLSVGINGPYSNVGATIQAGEVAPPNGSCTGQLSWCNVINNTVWFTFVAPPSGRISMHFLPGNWDSEIAVYSAPNCAALTSGGATLLAANDDSTGAAPFNAFISPLCVTPGVTYYVQVDGYGATTNANFRLLLKDEGNIPPVITGCPANITVPNTPGACNAIVSWTAPTATDCPGFTFTSTHTPGNLFPIGTTTVTYTANDGVNPPVLCTFTVTVNDTQLPSIACAANVSVNNDAGLCFATVALTAPTTSDNCGVATVTNNAPATYPIGVTNVTWTVTDVNGNVNTCVQTVTVTDIEFPSVTCPANVNSTTDAGMCTSSVAIGTPTTSDNCGILSVTNNAPAAFPVGTTNVLWTVTDNNGNVTTCNQTVVITDGQNPTVICPINLNISTDAGVCTASGVALGTPTTSDNCGVAIVTNNAPGTFFIGITNVTWTVVDVNGNVSTCVQTVTVADTELPAITCPINVSVNADAGSCVATGVALGTATTSDNCGVTSTTNNAPATYPVGVTNVTWTVTDVNGNVNTCIQTVTVTDNQNPTITCAANVNVNTDAGLCTASVTLVTPTITDNCPGATVTNNAPALFPIGTTSVVWTVTDVNGNTATCAQTVTVSDAELPVFTSCPTNITMPADAGVCTAVVTWTTPVATDNCSGATTTQTAGLASGSAFPLGVTNISYTSIDGSGNSVICSFTVTVTDNQNPVITCPTNVNANLDAGLCTASGVALGTPVTSDNCSVATVTNDAPATYSVGVTTVTWTVTDGSGNTATCMQTVTVTDNQNPTITCPATVNANTDAGMCTASGVALGTPVTADNCGPTMVTNDAPAVFNIGATLVTWTVTDINGNSSTCVQTVNITDAELPVIICPIAVSATTDAGMCTASAVVIGTPTTSDNCSVSSVTNDAPAVFPSGVTIVTWMVMDAAGNMATCTQTVTVSDNELPVVSSCPSNISTATNNVGCTALVTWTAPVVTDNCGGMTTTSTHNSGDAFAVGTTTVTYTFTDGNGNTATCSFDVTVTNNLAAVATATDAVCNGAANGSINLTVTGGTPTYVFDWDNDGTGDNDDTEDLTVGAGTYTVIITDDNGCTTTTNATVNEPALLDVQLTATTNPTGCGLSDGTADVTVTGGTAGYMFDWDNDGTGDNDDTEDLSGLTAGSYILIVTDANGCTGTVAANLSDPNGPSISIDLVTNTTCNGGSNGAIDVTVVLNGGAVSSTTVWDDPLATTTDDISGLMAGIYNITVTDNNGCVSSAGATIGEPAAITSVSGITNVTCNAGADGAIDITVTGGTPGYMFDWDNDGTGDNDDAEDLTSLTPGVYNLTITDANGCTFTTSATITEPAAVTGTAVITNTSCTTGATDGAISMTTAGGTPAYTYDWDNDGVGDNDDSEDLTGLAAGTYTVIITDANGCTGTTSFNVVSGLPASFSYSTTLCFGGSVTVGSNTYTTTGVYTDVFTMPNGCDSTVTTNLTVNPPVNVATTNTITTITATSTSGTYQWIDCNNGNAIIVGATTQTFAPGSNGSYAVIVTELGCNDTSGCVNLTGISVPEISSVLFTIYPNPSSGVFQIQATTTAKAVVVNMLGEQIQSLAIYKGKNQLNLDNIACGPYMLKIVNTETDEVMHLERLLIQK